MEEAVFEKDERGCVEGAQKTTGFPVWLRLRVHVRKGGIEVRFLGCIV